MRCSLLTLSTYLDGELAPDRAGELEAHLVACQRCHDGLGYLREEQEHVRTLAAVRAAGDAVDNLLGTVGLVVASAPPVEPPSRPAAPAPAPVPSPSVPSPAPAPAPEFLFDLADSRAPSHIDEPGDHELTGSPQQKVELEPEETVAFTPPMPVQTNGFAKHEPPDAVADVPEPVVDDVADVTADAVVDTTEEPAASDEPVVAPEPGPAAPPRWSSSWSPSVPTPAPASTPEPEPTREPEPVDAREVFGTTESVDEPTPSAWREVDAEPIAPEPAIDMPKPLAPAAELPRPAAPSPAAPAVGPLQSGRGASWFDRARDAVALRWSLMRGGSAIGDDDFDDDTIQIVSGQGAPANARLREHPARAIDRPTGAIKVSPGIDPSFATPDGSFEMPSFSSFDDEPEPQSAAPEASERRAPEFTSPTPPNGRTPNGTAPPRAAEGPGRHLRGLRGERRSFAMPKFSVPKLRGGARHRSIQGPLSDRRLWIFGSAVVILALIGIMIGKSTSPAPHAGGLTNGALPNPTAIALPTLPAQASPAPSAASTPKATPTPRPTPAATPAPTPNVIANPANLTGPQTLGAGGTGFSVQDLRYGAHPGDFRIVFDLSSSGSPTTTVGFGNPTTLYVEFTGVTGGASPEQPPAGNTATAVKLLPPSTMPGKTVYEITLSKAATLQTSYLQGPVRLVIDLG
ncbi:MAG: anti-sigma factor [Candidatus Dormibacteria bacterium]